MSELPTGWVKAALDELAEFSPKHETGIGLETEVSFVPMPSVCEYSGEIIAHETRQLAAVVKGYTHFKNGDVLFAKITPCMENGKSAIARSLVNGLGYGSTEFHVMRPSNALKHEFLWRFLRQKKFREEAAQVMTGAVGQRRVPTTFLKAYPFPVPPAAEQCRIVAKLDALDARAKRARADLDRIPALVARAKQATLAKALQGELTKDWRRDSKDAPHLPDAFTDLRRQREKYHASRRGVRLKNLPPLKPSLNGEDSWIGCCLADVCELRLGYAFKSEWFSSSGPRLVRGANIAPGKVDWTDERRISTDRAGEYSDYVLRAGDIVIAMDRPVISTGIKVARISADDDGALLVQRVASPICSTLLDSAYAWLLFNSDLFRSVIERESTGSDLPHISGNDILGMEIPLPSVVEQQEIVRRIESAFQKIDRIAADAASASKLLGRLDQAILTKAFRGELVPQNPEDEPASILLERIKATTKTAARKGRGRKA